MPEGSPAPFYPVNPLLIHDLPALLALFGSSKGPPIAAELGLSGNTAGTQPVAPPRSQSIILPSPPSTPAPTRPTSNDTMAIPTHPVVMNSGLNQPYEPSVTVPGLDSPAGSNGSKVQYLGSAHNPHGLLNLSSNWRRRYGFPSEDTFKYARQTNVAAADVKAHDRQQGMRLNKTRQDYATRPEDHKTRQMRELDKGDKKIIRDRT
ncbi:hypothetical protein BY996DRAFT_6611574 [Phakopsora pachyrhizi]|nr:hypothetical protein BY996DRAFT_6611574 [Phakopsora pachyrhizi]